MPIPNFKHAFWRYLALGIVVILALLGFQYWRSHRQDKKADADVAASIKIDEQHKTQTEASAKVDTVIQTIIVHDRARTNSAGNLKHASDTAGRLLADSSAMWHLRWQLVGMAYDTLSLAHTALLVVVDSLAADRKRWKTLADTATSTMDALRKDLAVARSGCRVILFVPCLSRKQTLIVGLVAGAVGYAEKDRIFRRP